MELLSEIQSFLGCHTPDAWLAYAQQPEQLPVLLVDHAHCEKKAASTAVTLMFRYVERIELINKMSRLAREELVHFEQVLRIINRRGFRYGSLSASKYAGALHAEVRKEEPARLVDTLIVGAFIEARSCERFAVLGPLLDEELAKFYRGLLQSEGRHYRDYLSLAQAYSKTPIDSRVDFFRAKEAALIQQPEQRFRFHSGIPLFR